MAKRKMSPAVAAVEWLALKAQSKAIEKKFDELKAILEPALRETPEKSAEFHGWKFSLVEFKRENFALAKAKEKIDGRILSPYISQSEIIQIRTSWQGGEESEAA